MMTDMDEQTEGLPALQRLALAYAPKSASAPTLGLLSLDERLASIVRRASEPILAQIKLAWWRDLLGNDPVQWPKGEPLVALLHHWQGRTDDLVALVDGWELCIGDDGDPSANSIRGLADARGAAFGALADLLGHSDASPAAEAMGRDWAMVDLAAHLPRQADRDTAHAMMTDIAWTRSRLPRDLRPLAILHGLAARSVRKGKGMDNLSPAALFPAMRIGLFGR